MEKRRMIWTRKRKAISRLVFCLLNRWLKGIARPSNTNNFKKLLGNFGQTSEISLFVWRHSEGCVSTLHILIPIKPRRKMQEMCNSLKKLSGEGEKKEEKKRIIGCWKDIPFQLKHLLFKLKANVQRSQRGRGCARWKPSSGILKLYSLFFFFF